MKQRVSVQADTAGVPTRAVVNAIGLTYHYITDGCPACILVTHRCGVCPRGTVLFALIATQKTIPTNPLDVVSPIEHLFPGR